MTPEKLTEKLLKAAPDRIKAVVLYGSAAAGDHAGRKSDYNILVITDGLSADLLKSFSSVARQWAKAGNPPPLLFTEEQLGRSADVFPIELLDIRECHRVLTGSDLISTLEFSTENLRLEIEHELRGKLIQLRQRYLLTADRPKETVQLMTESLSTFLVLFRAALRLFETQVPQPKLEALEELTRHIPFDTDVFETVAQIKAGELKPGRINAEVTFKKYLTAIETVVYAVDQFIHPEENAS